MSRSNAPPSPRPQSPQGPFSLAPAFHEEADTGSFHLGQFETMYETLFAESLEGGEISAEERERLNLAAAALGLDAERVTRLETALLTACETRADVTLVEDPSTLADRAPPSAAAPPLSDEKITLPPRGRALSDFDDEGPTLARPSAPRPPEPIPAPNRAPESASLVAGARVGAPQEDDDDALRGRFHAAKRKRQLDVQFCAAAVLVHRGVADEEHRAVFEKHHTNSPTKPIRALTSEAWTTLLFHPEEDRIAGEIFGVIASAALIGRVSAMRRDGALPKLESERQQEPGSSTVSIVRALAWAAATLGMRTPPIYLAPELDAGLEIITSAPPASRVGARMLTGQSALRLAFFSGRHLSWYREEHFVCTLVPSIAYLEDLFYAALILGGPDLPLPPEVRARANVIAEAMHPCLEPSQMERLRRLVARFLARGGVTNLKRWARAAEWTACRTGLLLCGDLAAAAEALASEARGPERVRQLETFWASDQATELRQLLGVSLGS